jgi:hypothetical protein
MLSRLGRILLIVWQVWCLNVFLPAHTRGAVTVGKAASHASCCRSEPRDDDRSSKPTPEECSRCSVCYFAAGLSTPPVVNLNLLPHGLLDLLDPPAPALAVSRDYPLAYYPCGPPELG